MSDSDFTKGASQGGYIVYAADVDLVSGKEAKFSIIDWKSWKLKRVCRSSLAAETQAFSDALDQLNWIRLFMAELLHSQGSLDFRRTKEILDTQPEAIIITDCKSLYDSVERQESAGLGLQEKRTAIEVTAIRQEMRDSHLSTRWVNSDRQLADILTKPGVDPMTLLLLARRGRWRIVFDPDFTSARKLKAAKRAESFKKLAGAQTPASEKPTVQNKGSPGTASKTSTISKAKSKSQTEARSGKKPVEAQSSTGKAISETKDTQPTKKRQSRECQSNSRKAKSGSAGPSTTTS